MEKEKKNIEITEGGYFVRQNNRFDAKFGNNPGELPVEKDKYRLLWAPICPWAHRAIIVRKILGLENVISLGTADPIRPNLDHIDWAFTLDENGEDPILKIKYLSEVYFNADPNYIGRPTVPALVDIKSKKVVENDYHNLTYYFERDFKKYHKEGAIDLFPKELEKEIRELNDIIFHDVNNGVYKCGFARSQEAYEDSYDKLFYRLDELEKRLSKQRYLHGSQITDSDIRLYTTLVRFDVAYYSAFNTNRNRIVDMPNLWGYLRDLYQTYGFGDTTDFVAIKKHYFLSTHINTTNVENKILPKGPDTSIFNTPHGRDIKFKQENN